MWSAIARQSIDPMLLRTNTTEQSVRSKAGLQEFYKHCCTRHHYFFAINTCGADSTKEEYLYVCGSSLFPEGHACYSTVVVEENVDCQSCFTTTYYASRCGFNRCCFVCGGDPLPISAEDKTKFLSIHQFVQPFQQLVSSHAPDAAGN